MLALARITAVSAAFRALVVAVSLVAGPASAPFTTPGRVQPTTRSFLLKSASASARNI